MIVEDFCTKTGIPQSAILNIEERQDSMNRTTNIFVKFVMGPRATEERAYNSIVTGTGTQYVLLDRKIIASPLSINNASFPTAVPADYIHIHVEVYLHAWKEEQDGIIRCALCKEVQGFKNRDGDCSFSKAIAEEKKKIAAMEDARRIAEQQAKAYAQWKPMTSVNDLYTARQKIKFAEWGELATPAATLPDWIDEFLGMTTDKKENNNGTTQATTDSQTTQVTPPQTAPATPTETRNDDDGTNA